ncbi:MAG: glutaredoxin 3 [Robiginitomaculum sp.]|nr:MAG: glutaredoxin 3 [Robiginitomaculum sp.]
MKSVTIYTSALCPYCWQAMKLLKNKNISFKEINVGMNAKLRQEMIQRSGGGTSVPQIFISEQHIGGCDEIVALEQAGKLDAMLAG